VARQLHKVAIPPAPDPEALRVRGQGRAWRRVASDPFGPPGPRPRQGFSGAYRMDGRLRALLASPKFRPSSCSIVRLFDNTLDIHTDFFFTVSAAKRVAVAARRPARQNELSRKFDIGPTKLARLEVIVEAATIKPTVAERR
jgi:hypothetical protein